MNDVAKPNPTAADRKAESSTPETIRRKSPRLPLEFPVVIAYEGEGGEASRRTGKTVSVNISGALIAVPGTISIGKALRLTNVRTGKEIACQVRSVKQKDDSTTRAGVEFETWCPEFWDITFPREEGDPEPALQEPQLLANARPRRPTAKHVDAAGPAPNAEGLPAPVGSAAKPQTKGWPAYKTGLVVLVPIVALCVLWAVIPNKPDQPGSEAEAGTNSAPFRVPPEVSRVAPDIAGFRLAILEDFAPQALPWLRSMRQSASGEISGNFAGSGESRAYIMLKNDELWRLVILADGQLRCDAQYETVAIAGLIPKNLVRRIQWAEPLSGEPDGDGLLLVLSAEKPDSGVVLFLKGTEVISGRPVDYQQIPIVQAQ